jgi:hypothetical protein
LERPTLLERSKMQQHRPAGTRLCGLMRRNVSGPWCIASRFNHWLVAKSANPHSVPPRSMDPKERGSGVSASIPPSVAAAKRVSHRRSAVRRSAPLLRSHSQISALQGQTRDPCIQQALDFEAMQPCVQLVHILQPQRILSPWRQRAAARLAASALLHGHGAFHCAHGARRCASSPPPRRAE